MLPTRRYGGKKTLRHDDGFTHGQHCHHFWWHLRLKIEQRMLLPVDRIGCELVDRLFKPTLLQLSFTVVQRITSVRNVSNTNMKKKEPLADRCLLLAPLYWTASDQSATFEEKEAGATG